MNETTENYVSGSVSKSYSRMKQTKYKGINLKTLTSFGVWCIVSIVILYPLSLFNTSTTTKLFFFAIIIVWWAGYVKYGRNSSVIERSIIHFKFVRRSIRGETEIAKFVQNTQFLDRFLPIAQVWDDGYIQYLNGTWGVMINVSGTRISGDLLLGHLEGVKHLLDSLYDQIYVTIISTTVLKHENLLKDDLLLKSKEAKSVPKKEHLVDLHNMVESDNPNYKGHEICIIVNLGPHESYDYAKIAREGFVPGYLDALHYANCTGHLITSRQQVYSEYRKKLNPMGV